ncbi:GDP-mannose-dependent alpha-(1-6)-phosphatidylinositol monomannoside mannosyltransferase [Lacticaseibacillus paracasei]|uniref:glycosyltransferase family 4 protein n=1 Tax=Lacticaseibacillus paracasei TaxID=1597 RepID=UPI000F0B496C|nr:glycosyltransferase family 4 protein [Lacticaseibacillus paracasei]RNE43141.1 GDP-mannose-dependent alpha-(1-6)-phosphatidylinositol monomannoside mannosyltransferase [Lacticaseibacillus paracasei]
MKINIIMPGYSPNPIGGYKIVYQYASFFAEQGHQVHIYESISNKMELRKVSVLGRLRRILLMLLWWCRLYRIPRPKWFSFPSDVIFESADLMEHHRLKSADCTIGVGLNTAEYLNNLSPKFGRRFYFIQGFETFLGTKAEVIESWHTNNHKIVISTKLQQFGESIGEHSDLVQNFINQNDFFVTRTIADRPVTISMLYHTLPDKGTDVGLQVLRNLKALIPDLNIILFGVYPRPSDLPRDYVYYQNASIDQLREDVYNESAVFLVPSRNEGWGLTATEAMACGAALVSTRNGGVEDFATDKTTALLSDVDDVDSLTRQANELLTNAKMRTEIATRGVHAVSDFTITKSGNTFLLCLQK